MNSLFAQLIRLFDQSAPAPAQPDPAAHLMQDAGARAGLDGHEARELRQAAQAWLRVIR